MMLNHLRLYHRDDYGSDSALESSAAGLNDYNHLDTRGSSSSLISLTIESHHS